MTNTMVRTAYAALRMIASTDSWFPFMTGRRRKKTVTIIEMAASFGKKSRSRKASGTENQFSLKPFPKPPRPKMVRPTSWPRTARFFFAGRLGILGGKTAGEKHFVNPPWRR